MAPAITIDATGKAHYPWKVTSAYSPPESWDPRLSERVTAEVAAKGVSEFFPPEWIHTEIEKIQPLVGPPLPAVDAEIHDLFLLMSLRDRYEAAIINEDSRAWVVNRFLEVTEAFGVSLGQVLPQVNRTLRNHLELLIGCILNDVDLLIFCHKAFYNRARPYQVAPGLMPMMQPKHPAYPSGHSTQAHTIARMVGEGLLAAKKPKAAAIVRDYAMAVARRREIAGVHYASDTVAGMLLADVFCDRYLDNPAFVAAWITPMEDIR
jgi:membrane-associated phospholipid phosphatase